MTDPTASRHQPLEGYRVLELGSTAAGPACARLLADFGAEVVKVEPKEGDTIRRMGGTFEGKSMYAASIVRNKALISVDLRHPEGQALVRRLVPRFDIVVENFRVGGLEKWGLGYADLRRIKRDIIMVRISGFGQTGPYKDRPGYGIIGESMSGLRHMTGDPDRPPSRVAIPLTDYLTAMYGAYGAVMAVLARERFGIGQMIDAALYESAFSLLEGHVPDYEKNGVIPQRHGARMPGSAPNNLYPTRDGEHIHITAMADGVWQRLATAIGQPELTSDPRFSGQTARNRNEDALDLIIGAWTRSLDLADVERALDAAAVPACRIFTMKDIFANEHFRARDMLVKVPDEDLGTITLAGVVPKLSETPGRIRWAGRRVGQDTRSVLSGIGGLSEAEIDGLARSGIIYCEPPPPTAGG